MVKSKWEKVDYCTRRLPIQAGWLVKAVNMDGQVKGLTFVPDAKHEWRIEND